MHLGIDATEEKYHFCVSYKSRLKIYSIAARNEASNEVSRRGGLLPSSCRCIRTPSKPLFYGQKCYVRTFWCYILLYFRAVFDKCREEFLIEINRLSWANYGPKTISISFLPPPYFLPGKMSKIFNFYRCSKSLSGFDICPLCQSVQVIH